MKRYSAAALLGSALVISCAVSAAPAGLVPPTADEDPTVPSVEIEAAGASRRVHLRSFGDSSLPALLVMPGSVSDLRAYLPFRAFADTRRVVLWDQRGQGLSERVGRDELSFEAMVEEIKAVKELVSPGAPVALVGHSWSAVFAAMYAAAHPEDVSGLVLMEPFGFTSAVMKEASSKVNLMTPGYLDMAWLSGFLPLADHDGLDFRMLGMLSSGVRPFFKDPENLPPWPVWRVGGLALLTWEAALYKNGAWDYDLTDGFAGYTGALLFVGSDYSFIGYDFQMERNAPEFPNAAVSSLLVGDSGHRMVTENWPALESGIRAFLEASE